MSKHAYTTAAQHSQPKPATTEVLLYEQGDLTNDAGEYTCPTCGESPFQAERGVKSHHVQCHGRRLRQTRACASKHCSNQVPKDTHDGWVCSDTCKEEVKTYRPDGLYQLLYVLYVVEDRGILDTAQRAPYGKHKVRNALKEFGFYSPAYHTLLKNGPPDMVGKMPLGGEQ